ncbi:hypothetical protein FRB99_002860, partial [Tulasnella sp. 403]
MNKRRREASSGSSDEPSSKAARNKAGDQPEANFKKKKMYPVPLYLKRLISRLDDPEPLPEADSADWKMLDRYVKVSEELGENREGGPLEGLSPHAQARLAALRIRADRPRNQHPNREAELLNPYENLQLYASRTTLPFLRWSTVRQTSQPARIPKTGKSHRRSAITMESTTQPTKTTLGTQNRTQEATTRRSVSKGRNLRDITKIPTELFTSLVKKYSEERLPTSLETQAAGESCDDPDKTAEFLSLPCPGFCVPEAREKRKQVENESHIHNMVETDLETVSRILHVCNSDTRDWLFETPGGKGNGTRRSDIVWVQKNSGIRVDSRMVIEVKKPWVLTETEAFQFSSLERLPNEAEVVQRMQDYNSVEQMWAQVYDYCYNRNNWFFVLTSYDYWIFGVFSLDWGTAFITDPFPYDSTEPTILECLLYWTESAMFVPGLYEIPVSSSYFGRCFCYLIVLLIVAFLTLGVYSALQYQNDENGRTLLPNYFETAITR